MMRTVEAALSLGMSARAVDEPSAKNSWRRDSGILGISCYYFR